MKARKGVHSNTIAGKWELMTPCSHDVILLAVWQLHYMNDLFLEDSTRNDFECFQADFPTDHIFCQCPMNGALLTDLLAADEHG